MTESPPNPPTFSDADVTPTKLTATQLRRQQLKDIIINLTVKREDALKDIEDSKKMSDQWRVYRQNRVADCDAYTNNIIDLEEIVSRLK